MYDRFYGLRTAMLPCRIVI